ncbi:hypothetical protein BDW22DRAFT_909783 [Trametopsis cervina]|nr:hypothetical protein BDW22DRAFT_909783 [Trametopsis cervina]
MRVLALLALAALADTPGAGCVSSPLLSSWSISSSSSSSSSPSSPTSSSVVNPSERPRLSCSSSMTTSDSMSPCTVRMAGTEPSFC